MGSSSITKSYNQSLGCIVAAKVFYEAPESAISVNNVTAKKNANGSVTVHFGGDPNQPKNMPGWNYPWRPWAEVLDGKWFPQAKLGHQNQSDLPEGIGEFRRQAGLSHRSERRRLGLSALGQCWDRRTPDHLVQGLGQTFCGRLRAALAA